MRRLKIYPVKFDGRHFSPENLVRQVNSEENSQLTFHFGICRVFDAWTLGERPSHTAVQMTRVRHPKQ